MEVEYVSGLGKDSIVPEEIKGWNWGAFFLNWIWGIGNSTYISLLMFVPFVNLIMMLVLGIKGNEWAWRNRTWRDIDHFKSTQKKWRNASLIIVFVMPLFILALLSMMKGDAYQLSLDTVQSNEQVINIVGPNSAPGYFVLGEVSQGTVGGEAEINYTLSGDNGSVDVFAYATKAFNDWQLQELVVVNKATDEVTVLLRQIE